jgi:iron-sulfur cluster assembly protein
MGEGQTLADAETIRNTQIAEELSLPPVKIHCSILAEDAIKAAVADYKKRHGLDAPAVQEKKGRARIGRNGRHTDRKGRGTRPELSRQAREGVGLRIGVRTSGCSGMAYKLEFADAVDPSDLQFESHGVRVVVDPKSLPYVDGTELDYTREGLNEGIQVPNPNVKDECGCGESFNV